MIGSAGLVLAVVVGVLELVNTLTGSRSYGGCVPTLMGLVLSRQIEALRMGGFRHRVIFRRLGDDRLGLASEWPERISAFRADRSDLHDSWAFTVLAGVSARAVRGGGGAVGSYPTVCQLLDGGVPG